MRCGADRFYLWAAQRPRQPAGALSRQPLRGAAADLVALVCSGSLDMVVAILGILKTGAAFLPISGLPGERIAFLLKDPVRRSCLPGAPRRSARFSGETLCLEDIAAQPTSMSGKIRRRRLRRRIWPM